MLKTVVELQSSRNSRSLHKCCIHNTFIRIQEVRLLGACTGKPTGVDLIRLLPEFAIVIGGEASNAVALTWKGRAVPAGALTFCHFSAVVCRIMVLTTN